MSKYEEYHQKKDGLKKLISRVTSKSNSFKIHRVMTVKDNAVVIVFTDDLDTLSQEDRLLMMKYRGEFHQNNKCAINRYIKKRLIDYLSELKEAAKSEISALKE